jgi:hypothetical protein
LKPKPDLVVVQIMDNDMVCPAAAPDYDAFRSTFASALDVLAKGTPDAKAAATAWEAMKRAGLLPRSG